MKKHKIVEISYEKGYEKAERLMNEMSEQGWETVCVTSDYPRTLKLLITFCREEPAG